MSFAQEVLALLKRASGAMTNSEIREGLGLEQDNESTTKISSSLHALRKAGALQQTTNAEGKPAYLPVEGYKPKARSGGIPSAKGNTRAARKAKASSGRPRKADKEAKPKRKYTRRAIAPAPEARLMARVGSGVVIAPDLLRRLCVLAINPTDALTSEERGVIASCLLLAA